MVENTEGQVALKYMSMQQKLVTAPSGNQYVFIPKNHISLAWVEESDVDPLLASKHDCKCGSGKKKNVILMASDTDVRRYYNGGR